MDRTKAKKHRQKGRQKDTTTDRQKDRKTISNDPHAKSFILCRSFRSMLNQVRPAPGHQDGAKTSQDGAKTSQDGTKTLPRRRQDEPRRSQDALSTKTMTEIVSKKVKIAPKTAS